MLKSPRAALIPALLAIVGTALCQEPADTRVKEAIRKVLLESLNVRDLSLPKSKLAAKVARGGRESRIFEPPWEGDLVTRVQGSAHEWVVMVASITGDLGMHAKAYWLGAPSGRLMATAIPYDKNTLTGPLIGEWRHHGDYLIGVGIIAAFHSPTWQDGDIRVFTVGPSGLVLRQSIRLDFAGSLRFASASSDDVVGSNRQEFQSITGRHLGLTRDIHWRFSSGRYRVALSRIVHDELWALDRLVTAVKLRQFSLQRRMIPGPSSRRRWLVKQIWECIRDDRLFIDPDAPAGAVGLCNPFKADGNRKFWLRLRVRGGVWVVDSDFQGVTSRVCDGDDLQAAGR
ncbi:MAG: hypothetical protein HYR64_03125 [Fimbriimonas ginsengisoli]|uniref:Uncharacterized protein n=1 Tax=Fimbriimonas ginsengisoli TaxID=1005039 RepID=A0A931LRD5_FIMGI|nr:hypothetical protein [Fimbriimonas ginsengisoli]